MKVDKKARGSQLRFVVLDELAKPVVLAGPSEDDLRAAYTAIGGASMKVLVLNGPNLGRLGRRQPEIYGTTTHAELAHLCVEWGRALGLEVEVRQTNHEGDLLDWLNTAADDATPVVLNAAAWSHYSYAVYDACAQLTAPLVEVHISDPSAAAGGVPPHLGRHAPRRRRDRRPGHRRLPPGARAASPTADPALGPDWGSQGGAPSRVRGAASGVCRAPCLWSPGRRRCVGARRRRRARDRRPSSGEVAPGLDGEVEHQPDRRHDREGGDERDQRGPEAAFEVGTAAA